MDGSLMTLPHHCAQQDQTTLFQAIKEWMLMLQKERENIWHEKKETLTLFESHNFTALSEEEVANIFVPGWNLTSEIGAECDCDVVIQSQVSM